MYALKNRTLRNLLAAVATFAGVSAFAGTKDGGGGGAYFCPHGDRSVGLWADLWEAGNTPFRWPNGVGKVSVERTNDVPAEAQFARAMARIASVDPYLAKLVRAERERIFANVNTLPDRISIALPDDLKLGYFPTGCAPLGVLYYNGESDQLDMKKNLFDALETQTDVAAAWMHEALYKVLRDEAGAGTSKGTRRLVACAFSRDDSCLAKREEVPTDRIVFECESESYRLIVVPEDPLSDPKQLISGGKRVRALIMRLYDADLGYVPSKTFQLIRNEVGSPTQPMIVAYQIGPSTTEGGMERFGVTPRVNFGEWTVDPRSGLISTIGMDGYNHFYQEFPNAPGYKNRHELLTCRRVR